MSYKFIEKLFWDHTNYPNKIIVSLNRYEEYERSLTPQTTFSKIGLKERNRMFKYSAILFDEKLKDDEFKIIM